MPKKRKLPVPGKGKGKGKGKGSNLRPFHQFSLLPAELRARVWKLVDPEPRVVELRHHRVETKKKRIVDQIRCLSRAPAILHVCRESRRVAMEEKLYQKAFVRDQRYTWINYEIDMISITPLWTSWLEAERPLIQRFRFESENDEIFFHFQSKELRDFTSLRELHIVCLDPVGHWIKVAEEIGFPTENVFFMRQGDESTRMYSRQQLLEMNPARPFAEYSNSYYRQLYDKRIKGTEEDMPAEVVLGVSGTEP
ncbi:hypothetical protein B0I35DRAFT_434556 [Stachybotrys elegans]|uniref:2EXR domain-containing protein n=1 Tax=Stachybotrys elegans TaxID=80388 RepID=A0A8K0SL47_9HYPO|nr:hypothetical protein B0I35DRAFT_434556 [Stachybotrys elegans]